MTEQFDPTTHTVAETQDYLASADADERQRVQDAEAAGQGRKGIVEWVPSADQVEPSEDGYTRVPVPEDQAYRPGEPVEREDGTQEV